MVNILLHQGTIEKDLDISVVVNFQLKKYSIYRLVLTKTKQILAQKPREGIRSCPLSFPSFFFKIFILIESIFHNFHITVKTWFISPNFISD